MYVRDEDGNYQHIKCDVCEEISPPAAVLLDKGGLQGLGWYCSGGKHRCPEHFDEQVGA